MHVRIAMGQGAAMIDDVRRHIGELRQLLIRLPRSGKTTITLVVDLAGFSICCIAALWLIRDQLETSKSLEFDWVVHNRARALSNGIENGLLAVTSIRDFISAAGAVEASEFQRFASSQLETHQALHALMWIPTTLLDEERSSAFKAPGYILSRTRGTRYPETTREIDAWSRANGGLLRFAATTAIGVHFLA